MRIKGSSQSGSECGRSPRQAAVCIVHTAHLIKKDQEKLYGEVFIA